MANDIIDINVYETTETVSITVNPNLTTININEVTGVGGSQNLQSVTNFGNTTTTSITANLFIKSGGTGANVLLDNGTTTVLANLGTKNDINSKQLQLNYLDRDNSIFDAFYLRTIADSGTVDMEKLGALKEQHYLNALYKKNNLISKNVIIEYDKYYAFDNKEIYSIKQKVIELTKKLKEVTQQFDSQSDSFFTSGRLMDHGMIDPRDTRNVIGFCLTTCEEGRARKLKSNTFGIARM